MRIAFVGDVHGMAVELMRMLRRLEAHGVDRIIGLGDYCDRGPASAEVIRIMRSWTFTTRKGKERCLEAVLGNHDENHLYSHYKRILPGRDFVPRTQYPDVTESLTEADYRWLDRLPLLIQVRAEGGKRFTAVHGGFHPSMKTPGWYSKHSASKLCRIGYFGPNGEILSPYATSGRFWADEYDGRFGQVFFGHTSHQKVTQYKHAVAVDTSKYGKLAAVVVSTEPNDPELACFYEDHVSKWSEGSSRRSSSSSSSWGSSSSSKPKEVRGEQGSLFSKADLDRRPTIDPKTTPLPKSEPPKTPPVTGGPAGQKTDDWLKRIGIRPPETKTAVLPPTSPDVGHCLICGGRAFKTSVLKMYDCSNCGTVGEDEVILDDEKNGRDDEDKTLPF